MRYPNITEEKVIAFDTETTGLHPHAGDRVFGFSISLLNGMDYYFDVRKDPSAVDWFNRQMMAFSGTLVCHNLSFDYRMAMASDMGEWIDLDLCYDTCIAACLINEHEVSYSLDNLSRKYCGNTKKGTELYEALAGLFGGAPTRNVQMKNISRAPVDIVAPYAKSDTRATLDLYIWQQKEIEKQGLQSILRMERRLTPILIKSEMRGIRVDTLKAEEAVIEVEKQRKILHDEVNRMAGFNVNVNATAHIKKIFTPQWKNGSWIACDGTPLVETKSGAASLNVEALNRMTHPLASKIVELRGLDKTISTFLMGHVLESSHNGRVYPTINQNKGESGGTGTGRLSYSSPALQQIPDRNPAIASKVKSIFLPEEGQVWVDADMASFEVRIFAHLVGSKDIQDVYRNDPNTDFHQFVADLTGLPRNPHKSGEANAKQLNLSMIFNQGNGMTADQMGLPFTWESFLDNQGRTVTYKKAGSEAMKAINTYHSKVTGVKQLADKAAATAKSRGYLFTRRGRHLRFPNGYKTYKASGLLIQSTAADENKMNWMLIDEALEGTGGHLLLNTHDSYSLSLPDDPEMTHAIAKKVKEAVEKDRGLKVPLILEVQEAGANWWESKKGKRWM